MQIALLNNKGLQASFAELGIAEADLVQAGRHAQSRLLFRRMRTGNDVEIDRSIMFDLVGLLTMPLRSGIEQRRFEQAKLQAASQAVRLARDTRKAYFNAVAAQQTVQYMEQVGTAAEASAELAKRMARLATSASWTRRGNRRSSGRDAANLRAPGIMPSRRANNWPG